MNEGKNSFVKTGGKPDDQAATGKGSGKLPKESDSIVIALPCEICEELCPSDKLMDHQLQCQKEREDLRRSAPRAHHTSPETREFAFNGSDSLPVHGVRYIEVKRGYSPTIEFEDDAINDNSTDDIATDFFSSGDENRVDFSPQRGGPFSTSNDNSFSSTRYIEIQRSYSPMMEFEDDSSPEMFRVHNIPEFIHTRESTRAFENSHKTGKH